MSSSGGPSKGRRRQERPPPGMQRHGWKRYVRAAGLSLAAAYILTTTRVLRMQRETDGHGGGRTAPTTAGRPFVKVPSGSASSSDWSWSSSSSSALRRHEDRGVAIVDGTGAGSHLPPDRAVATSLMAAPLLLQAKLDRIVSETGGAYQGTALWELSDLLPGWMREYMEWHGTERRILTRDSWRSGRHRVVVLDCPRGGVGGDGRHSLAECFTAIPYLLRECHAAGRLLFLHWTGPTSLAEFLVPPIGGLDWRLPKWLEREIVLDGPDLPDALVSRALPLSDLPTAGDVPLLRVQPTFGTSLAESSYNSMAEAEGGGEPSFSEIFHDCWRVLFRPSGVIEKIWRRDARSMRNMSPGGYVSFLLPSGRRDGDGSPLAVVKRATVAETVEEALKCASQMHQLQPGGSPLPLLVLTDGPVTTNETRRRGEERSILLWTREFSSHDAGGKNATSAKAEDYYGAFVDLYLMGMGSCVISYRLRPSQGGDWAYLASLIGYDSACYEDRSSQPSAACRGKGTTTPVAVLAPNGARNDTQGQPPKHRHHFGQAMPEEGSDYVGLPPSRGHPPSFPADEKPDLPGWMTRYFRWHNHTRQNLSPSNWDSTRYLILGCLRYYNACGGISDRLKPLPMVLLEASRHKRLLLIWWERPMGLEEFLVPPTDGTGVNWTVPEWLKERLRPKRRSSAAMTVASNFQQGDALLRGGPNQLAVFFKIQTPSAGQDLYGEQPDSLSTYGDVFHGLFRRFFSPVPRLAERIRSEMARHGLVPGQYSAAHLRAMYGNRGGRDAQELAELAVLGVNCASNLHPGGPVYFASDTAAAVDAAGEYGRGHSLAVATADTDTGGGTNGGPLHFDKDVGWENRTASDYDATFVDLYMLAESRCVVYSNGGYGTFGSLLSHDAECNMRFFKGRKTKKSCRWMSADGRRQELEVPNKTMTISQLHGEKGIDLE